MSLRNMTDLNNNAQSLPRGTRLEEFVIEKVLGAGGFGITYLARDTRLDRLVVIKENLPVQFCFRDTHSLTVAPRHTSGEDAENFRWSLENFSRESAILASLDHPGIVKVLRSFEAFGTAYFAMPFVDGLALDALARERKGKNFGEAELRGLLERVLAALSYLHDRGIYHRDIKPGNLLITRDGVPMLIDFGSARQRLSERSMTVVESPGYTPSEQLQTRGNIGPWSDLYAMGGTLVKLITGEVPPKTNDRTMGDPWVPLSERADLAGQFSPSFLSGIDRALRLPIAERWQNASEWQSAMRGKTGKTEKRPVAALPTHPSEASTAVQASAAAIVVKKKPNWIPWIVVACVALGLIVVGNHLAGGKEELRSVQVVDESVLQRERDKAAASADQAREAEQRAAQAEREKQALIDDAKAKEEALKKQRAAEAEGQREAKMAQEQAEREAAAQAEKQKRLQTGSKAGEERDFEIAPGVSITMCWIPPGEFLMGSPTTEEGRSDDETQHRVKISKGFWLGKTETTQAQWQAVMGNNPSNFKGKDLPVESVSWNDIAGPGGFMEKVNQSSSGAGARFNLPTEAQWEYACRAGTTGPYAGNLDQMAWYVDNSGARTHPVGGKQANAWGMHDMHGNVWEWCLDWYGSYPTEVATDPQGAASGSFRVFRGGGWVNYANYCRAALRYGIGPSSTNYGIGFRVARSSGP